MTTFMTRQDNVGCKPYDSIAWIFRVHIKEVDEYIFEYAVLYGNEDAPSKIELYRDEPEHDTNPDRVWRAS